MIPTGMPRKDTKPPYWGWSFKGGEVQKSWGYIPITLAGSHRYSILCTRKGMDWGYANTEPGAGQKEEL